MKKIIIIPLFFLFSMYWGCTILFNIPNNFINISLTKQSEKFNTFFFQKWSFFAPPPKFNDRLYYTFYSNTDTLTFEVLEPLNLKKQKNAPFNWNEDLLDYVLSNSVSAISDEVVEINQIIKNDTSKFSKMTDSTKSNYLIKQIQKIYCFRTLRNYSHFVAKKNKLNVSNYKVQLQISRKYIPNFSERHNIQIVNKEEIFFKSEILDLP
jgi:hypothetical protein